MTGNPYVIDNGLLSSYKITDKIKNDLSHLEDELYSWARINELTDNGKAPLHIAVDLYNKEAVELLLKNGADPFLKTKSGKNPGRTPLELALENYAMNKDTVFEDSSLVDLFKKYHQIRNFSRGAAFLGALGFGTSAFFIAREFGLEFESFEDPKTYILAGVIIASAILSALVINNATYKITTKLVNPQIEKQKPAEVELN